MARKNLIEEIKPVLYIANIGNWNYKNTSPPVNTKHVANVKLGNDNFCFTHQEILDIIDLHINADMLNTLYINSPYINTGEVKAAECSLIEKIKEKIKEMGVI